MRRPPVQPGGRPGRFDWKRPAGGLLERRFEDERAWLPCAIMDLVRSCGWQAKRRVMAGEEVVSEHGVHYRVRVP